MFSARPKATVPRNAGCCGKGKKKMEKMEEIWEIPAVPEELGISPGIWEVFLVGERQYYLQRGSSGEGCGLVVVGAQLSHS